MKVIFKRLAHLAEPEVLIQAAKESPEIQELMTHIQHLGKPSHIIAKKEENIYQLDLKDILRFVIENRQVLAKTATDSYRVSLRLYQIREGLDERFLQISQSEIVQLEAIDHLRLLPNGLIELTLKNGDTTFSSRRYLKDIKAALDLHKK